MGKTSRIIKALESQADNKFIEANMAEAAGFKSDADNLRRIGETWRQTAQDAKQQSE